MMRGVFVTDYGPVAVSPAEGEWLGYWTYADSMGDIPELARKRLDYKLREIEAVAKWKADHA